MADRIFVLAGNRVIEHGTHDVLLAAGGQYARMYRQQASAYAPDPAPDEPSAATLGSTAPEGP